MKRVRRRRRHGGSIGGGTFGLGPSIADAIGGFIVGYAVKQGWVNKLPALPVIGRTGTAAIALRYWANHGGGEYVRRSATAAAVLAGYTLGSTGTILGEHLQSAGRLMSTGDDDADGDYDDAE